MWGWKYDIGNHFGQVCSLQEEVLWANKESYNA